MHDYHSRKKYRDEMCAVEGFSCNHPFDPEEWDAEDIPSNADCERPRDLDKTSGLRKKDGDFFRSEHGAFHHEGQWICRGVNWT